MIQKSIIRLLEHNARLMLRFFIRKIRVFAVPMVALFTLCLLLIATGCGGLVSHKVEQGESLYSIGFYYGHDYRDIAKWNDIPSPYLIRKGQWIRLTPPDEKWWEEEQRRRNAPSSQGSKNTTANTRNNANGNNKDQASPLVQQNAKTVSSGRAGKSQKHVIVPDFTDKVGKIDRWVWPTKGRLLNGDRKFSQRNKGVDIVGRRGQLVYAAAAGKIVYSGSGLIGYGKLIIVKHNKIYLSAYAHNDQILVKEGDIVKRGERIARMGRTQDNVTKLHFEIRRYGKPVDPLRYLSR